MVNVEYKYWKTPEDLGLSQEKINSIAETLWKKEQEESTGNCPDCGTDAGKNHRYGCDVARCKNCGGQALSCGCDSKLKGEDEWDGTWPGTKECYEQKLITTNDGKFWSFDYNTLAVRRARGRT